MRTPIAPMLLVLLLGACGSSLPDAPRTAFLPEAETPAAPPDAPRVARAPAPGKSSTQPLSDAGLRPARSGTGLFVLSDGSLLTNNHVVAGCSGVSVETTDGTEARATLVAGDPGDDLALLRAEVAPPATAIIDDKVSLDNRPVIAIGYPNEGLGRIKPLKVAGTLSGPTIMEGRRFVFQADIRQGDSGGPLLGENGLVAGIVVAKIDTTAVFRDTGKDVRNLGFAIPNEVVLAFLAQQGLRPASAGTGRHRDEDELFEFGRQAVARVVCWNAPG